MTLGRYARDVPVLLLFVIILAASGCEGQDNSRTKRAADSKSSASATTAERTVTPATADESPRREGSSSERRTPVEGPTRAEVMRRLDARRIGVDRKHVTIDRQTLACGRAGTAREDGRRPRIRFRCVQPTFPAGKIVGPDVTFFVHPSRAGRLVITNARLTSY